MPYSQSTQEVFVEIAPSTMMFGKFLAPLLLAVATNGEDQSFRTSVFLAFLRRGVSAVSLQIRHLSRPVNLLLPSFIGFSRKICLVSLEPDMATTYASRRMSVKQAPLLTRWRE